MYFTTHLYKVYAIVAKNLFPEKWLFQETNFDLDSLLRLYTVFRHWPDTKFEKIRLYFRSSSYFSLPQISENIGNGQAILFLFLFLITPARCRGVLMKGQ